MLVILNVHIVLLENTVVKELMVVERVQEELLLSRNPKYVLLVLLESMLHQLKVLASHVPLVVSVM
jgi:hypothetical protein